MEIDYRTFAPCDLKGSAVIIGFPSLGLVSSIATNFLSRELKQDLIGGFTSPDFPPYCVLQDGVPMPQIRVFSAPREIDPENPGIECNRLSLITTEFIPKPEFSYDIAMSILKWLVDNEVKTVITLDGIPMFTPGQYELIAAASGDSAKKMVEDYEIQPFNDGMVRGISGILLYECSLRGIDIVNVMGTAKSELPDPIGGAHLLELIKKMFPEVDFDTEPLYEEAAELNKRINSRPAQPHDTDDSILYG